MTKKQIENNFKKYLMDNIIMTGEDLSFSELTPDLLDDIIRNAKEAKRQLIQIKEYNLDIDLYSKLKEVIFSDIDDRKKYDIVFSNDIYHQLLKQYPTFNFDDSDSSYKESINELHEQLNNHITQLKNN
jgi:hypothetical protein